MKAKRILLAAAIVAAISTVVVGQPAAARSTSPFTSINIDSYIRSDMTGSNFGTSDEVLQSSSTYRGLYTFDTSDIPTSNIEITDAHFFVYNLTDTTGWSPGGVFQLHKEPTTWTETGVTWANQPTWDSNVITTTSSTPTKDTWNDIQITDLTAITAGGMTGFGTSYSASGHIVHTSAREVTPPRLEVTYRYLNTGATYIRSDQTTTNFGNAAQIKQSFTVYRGLLYFDTSSIPTSGVTITDAHVKLYSESNPGGSGHIDLHKEPNTWTEGDGSSGVTWATQPTWSSTVISDTSATPTSNTWVDIPINSAHLDAIIAGGTTSFGTSYSASGPIVSVTSNDGTAANAPRLEVTYQDNVQKILTIVIENTNYTKMFNNMAYLKILREQYGYATAYTAFESQSLPNYLRMAGGSNFGITADCSVANCPIHNEQTVFDQAIANSKTGKMYAESMSSNCQTTNSSETPPLYVARHPVWPYFDATTPRANCNSYDVPAGTSASGNFATDVVNGALPNVGWLIPNQCNNGHDSPCDEYTADAFLKEWVPTIFAGSDWQSGHLAIVILADEDDDANPNDVLTAVIHPSVTGLVTSTALDHNSLCRLQEDVVGVSHLHDAATAADMATAFGLTY